MHPIEPLVREPLNGDRYGIPVTPRQRRALAEALVHGDRRMAAECMGISYGRTRDLICGAMHRLGAANQFQAAYLIGWVRLEDVAWS